MQIWKQFLSIYLDFTKKERTGTLALLAVIVLLIILPFLFPFFVKQPAQDIALFEKDIAALQVRQIEELRNDKKSNSNYQFDNHRSYQDNKSSPVLPQGDLFPFDPNTLDEAGWKKLGVRDKTIGTIKNYLAKGGKFYKPDDIHKIWGLSNEEKQRLEPFISIASAVGPPTYPNKKLEAYAPDKKYAAPAIIDINTADTTALIALPGIGSKLAQRIITFRDKLGGFISINQVGETFGLADSVFQKIKPRLVMNTTALQQLNINTATLDEMKAHPYLRYAIANAIFQYRNQHGSFAAVTDLKKIFIIPEEAYLKALPYLTVK